MNSLTGKLKRLSTIAPDGGFAARSRALVTALPQEERRLFFAFRFRPLAIGAFAVAAFAVIGSAAAGLFGSPRYGALSAANIQHELDNLQINIHLQEIELAQAVGPTVVAAITEVADTKPVRHLNKALLQTEQEQFGIEREAGGESVDELLQRVIF